MKKKSQRQNSLTIACGMQSICTVVEAFLINKMALFVFIHSFDGSFCFILFVALLFYYVVVDVWSGTDCDSSEICLTGARGLWNRTCTMAVDGIPLTMKYVLFKFRHQNSRIKHFRTLWLIHTFQMYSFEASNNIKS